MRVGYGACVGNWERFYVNHQREFGRPFVALAGQPSIAVAYNRILDTYADGGFDAVILVHDDLEIVDRHAEDKFLDALADPDVALVGVAGGTSDASLAWWNGPTIGHQRTNSGLIDFGQRTGEVALLEGSVLAFSPWAVRCLRFDEDYPGFHSYDEIALEARRLGKRVMVADVDTWHHVRLGFKNQESADSWGYGEAMFQRKWHGGMKINLGCGDRYVEGWHNVDLGSPHRKDQQVDLTGDLPWPNLSLSRVYAGHVLEHLSRSEAEKLVTRLLPLMMPGGQLMVVGPDVRKAAEVTNWTGTGHTFESIRDGGNRWPGDQHLWECDTEAVEDMLHAAGWSTVEDLGINNVPAEWPVADRVPQWQCAVRAVAG